MPNITSTIPIQDVNPIPISKTKKNKKNKKKILAVNTETSNSNGLIQEQSSPITPATTENSEHENVNKNPYMEVVYKRLRAMRKRMVKVEKCEEIVKSSLDGKNQLNADQLNSLEKKGELAAVIKEFEDILKSMEPVDKEEIKKEKAQKKAQQEENEKAISNATKMAKNEHTESIIFLLDFFRLVHFQQLNIVQLSDLESEAVETLRAKLTTMAEESKNEELKSQRIKDILDNVNKLQRSDENIIMNLFTNNVNVQDSNNKDDSDNSEQEITYSHLRSLIQSPPILETTEVQPEQDDSQNINDDTNNNVNQEEFVIVNRETENIAENNATNINESNLDQDEQLQTQSEIQTSTENTLQNQIAQENVQVTTENSIDTVESQTQQPPRVQLKQSFVPKQLGDTQPPPLTPRNQSNSNRGYRPTYRNNNNRTNVNNNGGYNNRGQSQRRESNSSYNNSGNYNNSGYNNSNYNNSSYNNGGYHGGPRGRGSRVGQFRPRPPQ